ncbi:MAG TPA: hypothetical protein HPP80_09945, partial [Rhodospirillaceae bacterium]|nr:hypothetical protein [Rhodospirillaceae bacterium]
MLEAELRGLLARALGHRDAGRLREAERDLALVAAEGYRRAEVLQMLAAMAASDGRLGVALARCQDILAEVPDDVVALTGKASILERMAGLDDATEQLEQAVCRWPEDPVIRHMARHAAARLVPAWHIPMMNDVRRNQAFAQAIDKAVQKRLVTAADGAVRVLDIGSGSGLLAMMAAQSGAHQVVSVEKVPAIAAMARRIVAL